MLLQLHSWKEEVSNIINFLFIWLKSSCWFLCFIILSLWLYKMHWLWCRLCVIHHLSVMKSFLARIRLCLIWWMWPFMDFSFQFFSVRQFSDTLFLWLFHVCPFSVISSLISSSLYIFSFSFFCFPFFFTLFVYFCHAFVKPNQIFICTKKV